MAEIGAITGISDDLLAAVRAEAAHVGQLSRSTLERLTCDCKVSRILTDGPSQVIDVGRATRTIPTALWNALVARDRHCTHPGCTRGPAYCEGHHVIHWSQGGATCLANPSLKKSHRSPQPGPVGSERRGHACEDQDKDA